MATGELLYDLLSVSTLVLARITREVIDVPLEPVRSNVERVGAWFREIRALQEEVARAFPAMVRPDPAREVELGAEERRLATCLIEAHRLERNGQSAEAVAAYQAFLLAETSLERRSIVAGEIERILEQPPDDKVPDLRPWESALVHVGALATSELEAIDQALLAATTKHFRKVAFVVATAFHQLADQLPPIPDVFYAQRVIRLVKLGQLEAQGNLRRMRYSEVRRPGNPPHMDR
jgi:hypothetical protein